MRVLEGDIKVGQQPIFRVGHQRNQLAHMRVGIDVMQTHPRVQTPQFARQIKDVAAHLAVFPRVQIILAVQPIGAGVLADHQKLAHTGFDQLFRLPQHRVGRA